MQFANLVVDLIIVRVGAFLLLGINLIFLHKLNDFRLSPMCARQAKSGLGDFESNAIEVGLDATTIAFDFVIVKLDAATAAFDSQTAALAARIFELDAAISELDSQTRKLDTKTIASS